MVVAAGLRRADGRRERHPPAGRALPAAVPRPTAPAHPPFGTAPPGPPPSGTAPAGDAPAGAPVIGASSDGSVVPGPVLEDEEAVQEQILDDLERYGGPRIPVAALAGRVAGHLAPGPDLAAWLAAAPVAELTGEDLAAAAGSWRRLGSWAQARELAAVAQIAARAAARDEQAGVDADGRPAQVPASAAAEVALELTMSPYSAAAWADLAVELTGRLAATGAALAAGVIDVPRARLIAEATTLLSQDHARAVEARVLPAAAGQTTGMLRAALRRAVLAIDPAGAEAAAQGRRAAGAGGAVPGPGPDRDAGRAKDAGHPRRRGDGPAQGHGPRPASRRRRRPAGPDLRPDLHRPAPGHPHPDPPTPRRTTRPATRRCPRRLARQPVRRPGRTRRPR